MIDDDYRDKDALHQRFDQKPLTIRASHVPALIVLVGVEFFKVVPHFLKTLGGP